MLILFDHARQIRKRGPTRAYSDTNGKRWFRYRKADPPGQGAQPGSSTLQEFIAHLPPASPHNRYWDAATNKTPSGQDLVWPTSWWMEETRNV